MRFVIPGESVAVFFGANLRNKLVANHWGGSAASSAGAA